MSIPTFAMQFDLKLVAFQLLGRILISIAFSEEVIPFLYGKVTVVMVVLPSMIPTGNQIN